VLNAALLAGYIVGGVILFVILRRLFPEDVLGLYAALAVSVIVAAGIVFAIYVIARRKLLSGAASLTAEQSFAVFGEDAREKPKNLRRRKR
jgi:hypothetical protein